jgi:hypothetical protein
MDEHGRRVLLGLPSGIGTIAGRRTIVPSLAMNLSGTFRISTKQFPEATR